MWWIMNSLDKVMVTSMISAEANGIYAVSYKIPSIIIVVTTIFNQAWMFSAVKEKDTADKNEYTSKVFKALLTFTSTLGIFMIAIIKPLTKLYVGVDFYDAWKYTSPLIVGTVFLTTSTFLSNEYAVNKDSKGFLKSSTIGAFTNLILNFLLIPKMQVFGAAIATCISYIVVLVFRYYDTKKYVKINYDLKIILNCTLLITSFIFVYNNKYGYYINTVLLLVSIIINNELWKSTICKIFNQLNKRRCKNESE